MECECSEKGFITVLSVRVCEFVVKFATAREKNKKRKKGREREREKAS